MKILLADPNIDFVDEIVESWNMRKVVLATVKHAEKLIQAIEETNFDAIFLSSDFLILDDLDIISYVKEHQPGISIVILAEKHYAKDLKHTLDKGISKYLIKPIQISDLESSVRKIKIDTNTYQSSRLMGEYALDDLLGQTPAMKKIIKLMTKVAPTTSSILITGESGTGKEFIAQNIHQLSKRHNEPFIIVNCGAIPENLVESELFGAKKGAYTGSIADKKGLFEEANGGTLFLDEVAELPPAAQVKLLRFLQDREIRKVGENISRNIDVRIIAATNRNVNSEVDRGNFREDLFYRLNTFQIKLPPLRDRKDTIINLIKFFAKKQMQKQNKEILNISKSAQVALMSYDYPGNIRELEHAIEHAIVLSERGKLCLEDLPEEFQPFGHTQPSALLSNTNSDSTTPLNLVSDSSQIYTSINEYSDDSNNNDEIKTLAEIEKTYIIKALDKLNNNQTETAKKLGISRSTLWRKVQNHSIKLD